MKRSHLIWARNFFPTLINITVPINIPSTIWIGKRSFMEAALSLFTLLSHRYTCGSFVGENLYIFFSYVLKLRIFNIGVLRKLQITYVSPPGIGWCCLNSRKGLFNYIRRTCCKMHKKCFWHLIAITEKPNFQTVSLIKTHLLYIHVMIPFISVYRNNCIIHLNWFTLSMLISHH